MLKKKTSGFVSGQRGPQLISLTLAAVITLGACSPRIAPPAAAEDASTLQNVNPEPYIALEPDNGTPYADSYSEPGQDEFDYPPLPGEILPVPSDSIMGAVTRLSTSTASTVSARPAINLEIPAVFRVTRPAEKVSTTSDSYFITGTSDPKLPVYIDGKEIIRQGSKGTFGVYVELAAGNNSFTLKQSDKIATITITRIGIQSPQPITAIVQNSMYPATQGGVKAGGKLSVECTAPSGGTVVASFDGRSVTLQQASSANPGMPATYRGKIDVGDSYPSGVTKKAGKVSYELRYNGKTTSYQSTGDVYVAGTGSYIAVRVSSYVGLVYPDPANPGVFREKLKTGAADYVSSDTNTHYLLGSGGYIPKGQCEIIEGEVKIGNKLTKAASFLSSDNRETFSFVGTDTPAYYTNYADGVFSITLYNTNGTPPVNAESSRLFSSVTAKANDDGSVTYTFTLKNTSIYSGYMVWYDGTNTVLRFRYKPRLSGNPNRPFEGITVMIDPGHGGHDPGALGVAGTTGPVESTLNLANAYAVMDTLTEMGAKVILTRSVDEFLELDQRLAAFEASDADVFIALHHNSMGESSDSNKINGSEIYYHTPHSANAAQAVLQGFLSVTGRKDRGAKSDYYRVTISHRAPSMLIELGFISNPLEYEKSCDPAVIRQSAKGVAEGLKLALK